MIDKKDILGILSAVEQTAHYTKEYSEYEIEIVHNTIETIRLFVSSYPEQGEFQIPDAPPYKIGDEGYRDMVGDQEYRSRVTCKLIMPQPSKTFEVCKSCGRVVCKQGDHHCGRTDDEWWYYDLHLN